ncbi:MAG: IS200/IS605 family transposase [Thermoplasmata archaeon]
MSYNLNKGAHSVYALQYHFIQVVKYRMHIFKDNKIFEFFKQIIRRIRESFGVEVIDPDYDKDHFHMIFRLKPTLDIPKYINVLKTIASREIQRNFPDKKNLYFLSTAGEVTLDMLKKYVEDQGK